MKKLITIYGPTTTNKLGLALNLAKYIFGKYHVDSEVINTDSRKIYKGFEISQSLPRESQFEKINTHLFSVIKPKEKLELIEFKELVEGKIKSAQSRDKLPILVGGSALHLRAVLENWAGDEKEKSKIFENILIIGLTAHKKTIKNAITKNVNKMFKKGLYEEFKNLYKQSRKGKVSFDLLNKTLGYRQFIELAEAADKSPLDLNEEELKKIKKWVIKDIVDFAYKQKLEFKKFDGIKVIRDFKAARKLTDEFI